MSADDRKNVRDYYDEWGQEEWLRLDKDIPGRVSWEIHRRFLAPYIKPGMHVLEIGAGPGRFTIELAHLDATVTVTDYSSVQLDLHRQIVGETDAERHVLSRSLLDICDTSLYDDGEFDAVVAYGGPLSYAFEEADTALAGLLRIVRPGGYVVASVMSLLGAWRYHLREVIDDIERSGEDAYNELIRTGDLRVLGTPHVCRLFRSQEISAMAKRSAGN